MGFDHYEPDTIERIGDQVAGYNCNTGVLANATYWTAGAQHEIFNVYGVIKVLNLFAEAITLNGANATTLQFTFTTTLPAGIPLQVISAVTAALGGALPQGLRIVWLGDLVGTAPVITATPGISDVTCVAPKILGSEGGTGTIGFTTLVAAASGTHQWWVFYLPLSDGAYVTAVL